MVRKQKAVSRRLRYDAELEKGIEAATKKGGFSSPSAFMREAIERELAGRESGVDAAEQRAWTGWHEEFAICGSGSRRCSRS
jgi:Arc/MetJ-type ribon-helix-helix transcriptional regulator